MSAAACGGTKDAESVTPWSQHRVCLVCGNAAALPNTLGGQKPEPLTNYGASPRPLTMTQDAAYKIAYPEGYMGGKHNLGMSVLKQLPYQIEDPVAILRSNTQDNSLVLLTEWKDGERSILVPLHLDKQGAVSVDNRIASAYQTGHIQSYLGDGDSNVLYTKNNEDIHQLLSNGVQFPKAMADDILARKSIPQDEAKRNRDILSEILLGNRRTDLNSLSNEQQNAVFRANEAGTVGMDAEGRVFQIDPEQHIDRRDGADIASQKVNAFQFDHPQLHSYYKSAAEVLMQELAGAQPGGQTQSSTGEYGQTYSWRTKRSASPRIETLLDNLTEVVRNGTYVGSGEYVQHSSKNKPTLRYDYFETPVSINGEQYIAKFDVEVLPGANNYRTHQIVKMDLIPTEASLAGPTPAASPVVSSPSEGTRPLNVDYNITQGAENVKSQGLDGIGAANAGSAEAAARYDNLGSAKRGFTTAGMEGTEKTSRPHRSHPSWSNAPCRKR